MRVLEVDIENFGDIKALHLDMTKIPDGIIVLTGPSGSSKTHLLECFFSVPLMRRLQYYNHWVQDHFRGTGSVKVKYLHEGVEYTSKIEGKRGETPSCYLWRGDQPIAGPGVRPYIAKIGEIFPRLELIMNSHYSVQGNSMGFFGLEKQHRQAMFSYMCGLQDIDNMILNMKQNIADIKLELSEPIHTVDTTQKQTLERRLQEAIENIDTILANRPGITDIDVTSTKSLIASIRQQVAVLNATYNSDCKYLHLIQAIPVEYLDCTQEELRQIHKDLSDKQNRINASLAVLRENLSHSEKQMSNWYSNHNTRFQLYNKSLRKLAELYARLADREKVFKDASIDLENELCFQCHLTHDHINTLKDIKQSILDTTTDIESYKLYTTNHPFDNDLSNTILRLRNEIASELQELNTISSSLKSLSPEVIQNIELTQEIQERIDYYNQHLKELLDGLSEHETILGSMEKFQSLQDTIEMCRVELDKIAVNAQATKTLNKELQLNKKLLSIVARNRTKIISTLLPRIEAETNTLIEDYRDGLFRIELVPATQNKTNSVIKESFDPVIINTTTGDRLDKVSGGEQNILSEALRMGFTVVLGQITDAHDTLARDEAASALDEDSIDDYIKILRSSLEHYKQVVVITHNQKIIDQADYVLRMMDGELSHD